MQSADRRARVEDTGQIWKTVSLEELLSNT